MQEEIRKQIILNLLAEFQFANNEPGAVYNPSISEKIVELCIRYNIGIDDVFSKSKTIKPDKSN